MLAAAAKLVASATGTVAVGAGSTLSAVGSQAIHLGTETLAMGTSAIVSTTTVGVDLANTTLPGTFRAIVDMGGYVPLEALKVVSTPNVAHAVFAGMELGGAAVVGIAEQAGPESVSKFVRQFKTPPGANMGGGNLRNAALNAAPAPAATAA